MIHKLVKKWGGVIVTNEVEAEELYTFNKKTQSFQRM